MVRTMAMYRCNRLSGMISTLPHGRHPFHPGSERLFEDVPPGFGAAALTDAFPEPLLDGVFMELRLRNDLFDQGDIGQVEPESLSAVHVSAQHR